MIARARCSTRSSSARSPSAAPTPTPSARDILSLLVGVRDEAGRGLHRPRDPRPGDDPDVRRPRHLDLDPHLHDARAGPPPRRRSPSSARSRTGCSAATSPTSTQLEREMPYLEMVLDEVLRLYPPAWIGPRRAVRDFEFGGYSGRPRRLRQLLLLGQPPHPRGLPRARGLHPRALHPRAQGGAAARRLRPLRRRPADLHRQALRPDRGEAGGDDAAAAAAPRRAAGPHDDGAPDADALAARAACGCGCCRAGSLAAHDAGAGHLRHPLRRLDRARPAARGVLPRAAGARSSRASTS